MFNADEISFYISQFKRLVWPIMWELFKLAQTRKLAPGEISD